MVVSRDGATSEIEGAKGPIPTNLDHEGYEVEWIIPHGDPTGVAHDCVDRPKDHAAHEEPRPPSQAEVDVDTRRDDV